MKMKSMLGLAIVVMSAFTIQGCQKSKTEYRAKAAVPVVVMELAETTPKALYGASGSVKSWKTEDIGFEVSGRVQWVLEPGKNIDGRVVDPDKPDKLIIKGTALAKIEPARYQIASKSAEANVKVAERQRDGITIRVNESLPALIESAQADFELAKDAHDRAQKLDRRKAISQSELEQANNLFRTKNSALAAIKADKAQALAELESAEAKIDQAKQVLEDANRDLANTTLYGSYQGQISKVMVVPGSVVTAGSPVLTLQMTNPIKVEVELSAQQSRTIRRQRSLPVTFALSDGTNRRTTAFVYNIDASADPTTRTFTLTLLLLNETTRYKPIDKMLHAGAARTEDVWPLRLNQMMGTPKDVILVEESSIRRDDQGAYLYQVTNAKMREIFPALLKVRRQRLVEHDLRIPFLGNWVFRSVSFIDDAGADETIDLDSLYIGEIVGEIINDGQSEPEWDGESVVVDPGSQWMLRPGDLVYVDLSATKADKGFYVPMEAIYRDSSAASLFVVNEGTVKRISVEFVSSDNLNLGAMMQVLSPELVDGMQVVVNGVHFLRDGQAVRIVGHRSSDDGSAMESSVGERLPVPSLLTPVDAAETE